VRQPVPFGKYLLLDRISVGGMAEVFKAKSYGVEGFEKIIAIKRILPTMGEDRDFIKMFIDEAKIAGQLAHANICQIFELGRIDGSHFIAMEYIWGKDLLQIQNRLRKNKQPMPIPMACFSIAKVLEGLDYAHRKRDPLGRPLEIVHRDCSPQNVLVSYEGEVKVIDFGIAKATSRNSRTMAGVLKGKFGYMSPEQVRGLPLDRRSDIFAIGTMLYECLTGDRLFQGETDFSTLEKVRNVDIQSPRAINPQIPEAIEKIILKALAKDVDDRYQWCSEMLADLQAFLMSQDVVFTAKSLSSWLKEVFAQEIERERQLLEQYKRVGRDGLIAGLPSAEAKLDVVEHLGEAGAPEGDATMLGGPNFDDIEQNVAATPEVSQAPAPTGGPRGSVKKASAPAAAAPAPGYAAEDEGEGDFGEEAPTEIFGELDGQVPPLAAAAGARAPTGSPHNKPPKPPSAAPPTTAMRPATQRPADSTPQPLAAAGGAMGAGLAVGRPQPAGVPPGLDAGMGYQPPAATPSYGQSYGTPPHQAVQSGPHAAPMGSDPAVNGLAQPTANPEVQRTVLGVQAPVGLGNYGSGPQAAYRPSQQQPAMQNPQVPMGGPVGPYGYPQSPQHGYPQQQGYPQQPYGQPQYPGYMSPYPTGPMGAATPVDQMGGMGLPAEGKKSTLVRDIAIGVGIAALVLVGFLVVKMVVLDGDSGSGNGSAATSKYATVKLSMPPGMTAEMIVDDKRVATVENDKSLGLAPGIRHIKLVGTNGLSCDDPKVKLEAGKTTTLECGFGVTPGATTGSASAGSAAATTNTGTTPGATAPPTETAPATDSTPATGSAAAIGTTPATTAATNTAPATGSAAAPAKAETKATETKTAETKTAETKTAETKATDTKAATKATETKATETKATETKATETKASETKATKVTESRSSTKSSESKSTTKASTTDSKLTEAKASDKSTAGDPTKGYLQVFSKPTAKILVDGVDTNMKTPISGHSLALTPGKHKITFVIGDDRFTYPVVIKAGSTENMSKDLQ
jgi:serine/threonine protein kinase